jgi:hypothetical protein
MADLTVLAECVRCKRTERVSLLELTLFSWPRCHGAMMRVARWLWPYRRVL